MSNQDSITKSSVASSSRSSKKSLYYEKLEEKRLHGLKKAFQQAAQIIIDDPLMNVMKEKKETREFMFKRMEEIIDQTLRMANDQYEKELLRKIESMGQYCEKLKKEHRLLTQGNIELHKRIEENEDRYNEMLENKIKEMSGEIDNYKETVNMLQINAMKIEETIRRLKDDNQDLQITLRDKEKLENSAVARIKSLEEQLERTKTSLSQEETSRVNELIDENEMKERQQEQLLTKIKEMEKEMHNNDCVSKELANELSRKMDEYKNEIERLKVANQELTEMLEGNSKALELKRRVSELERALQNNEMETSNFKTLYEDVEFKNEQLEETVSKLKNDICEQNFKLSEERKLKHDNEIKLISLQESTSELKVHNAELEDQLASIKAEVNF